MENKTEKKERRTLRKLERMVREIDRRCMKEEKDTAVITLSYNADDGWLASAYSGQFFDDVLSNGDFTSAFDALKNLYDKLFAMWDRNRGGKND